MRTIEGKLNAQGIKTAVVVAVLMNLFQANY
jgi:hypothetical protein